jgi:hypothetical protein
MNDECTHKVMTGRRAMQGIEVCEREGESQERLGHGGILYQRKASWNATLSGLIPRDNQLRLSRSGVWRWS